jgi:hypothetical protein
MAISHSPAREVSITSRCLAPGEQDLEKKGIQKEGEEMEKEDEKS